MALAERVLRFTFSGGGPVGDAVASSALVGTPGLATLATAFGTAASTIGSFTAAGLRAAASIQIAEGILGVQAQVKIWGLSMDQMNAYSATIPSAISDELPDANLIIEAGDLGGNFSQVINGPIFSSYIDLSDAPDSAFVVAVAGIADAATPMEAQSQPPQVPGQPSAQNAEDIIKSICAVAGFTFNNNGAHQVLRNSSTYGSAVKQIDTIARAAGFHWTLNGNTVSIWPEDGTVDDVVIIVGPSIERQFGGGGAITADLVGYPQYWPLGIIVTTLFNPQIQVGRLINLVGSTLTKANGLWQIVSVEHSLTTMINGGPWFTIATLTGIGDDSSGDDE